MTGRKYEPPLYIEMSFDEALGRYVKTDLDEVKGGRLRPKKKAGRAKRPARGVDPKGERQSDRKRQPP